MIPLLPVEEAGKRAAEAGISPQLGVLNVFRAMLQSPGAAAAVSNLLTQLLFRNTLDSRLRELVILRTGWRCASEYEFCQHVQVARRLKMSEQEILGVRDPSSCTAYNESRPRGYRDDRRVAGRFPRVARDVDDPGAFAVAGRAGRAAARRRQLADVGDLSQ